MWLYYCSILLIVVSNIIYHISQKATPGNVNPILSLIVTYLTAILFAAMLLPFYPLKEGLIAAVRRINGTSILLGVSVVGIELGFLLAYRTGWNISSTQFSATILLTLLLIPIGLLFFHEKLTLVNILGVLLCFVGFILVNHR